MVQAQVLSGPDGNLAISGSDDFKRIHGIGPGIERRLHMAGILSYSQLSALQAQEIAEAVGNLVGMSAQRVLDQEWIDQARQLDAQSGSTNAELDSNTTESRQHYAVFTVELLLDDENHVRRTRATYVQSQTQGAWAGWEEHRLENFFIESASIEILQPAETVKARGVDAKAGPRTPTVISIDEDSRREDLSLRALETEYPQKAIRSGQPFRVRLMLDLENADQLREDSYTYSVTVYAKEMSSASRQIIRKAEGSLPPGDHVNLDVENMRLTSGTYRIESLLVLSPSKLVKIPGPGVMAMTEGSLLQVY